MKRHSRFIKDTRDEEFCPVGKLHDACGRLVDPQTDYVWTFTAVKGSFEGIISSKLIGDCVIIAYVISTNYVVHAIILDQDNSEIAQYRLDPETARPVKVSVVSLRDLKKIKRSITPVLPDCVDFCGDKCVCELCPNPAVLVRNQF